MAGELPALRIRENARGVTSLHLWLTVGSTGSVRLVIAAEAPAPIASRGEKKVCVRVCVIVYIFRERDVSD